MTNQGYTKPKSRAEALAEFFKQHPGEWFDGCGEIARIGGRYGWRSRLSDARRDFGLNLVNRQRRITRDNGESFILSEYALLGTKTTSEAA